MRIIPFVKPWLDENDTQSILETIKSRKIGSLGTDSRELEKRLKNKFHAERALLVGSCTHALEIGLLALNLKRDDEVICPSFTFVTTVSSIVKAGGKPVFVDIEPHTLGLNPRLIEKAISKKTKAVVLVHYGGLSAQAEKIKNICLKYKIRLIEDAAQGFLANENGKYLGTFGDIGCFSFHQTKNITSGEGGLLLVNNDIALSRICEEIRSFGTDKESFLRGEVDKYEWHRIGGSYFMTDIQAALLKTQLRRNRKIRSERKRIYKAYHKRLNRLKKEGVAITIHPPGSNFHLFWLVCRFKEERNKLLQLLQTRGIQAAFHFLPLHMSPYVKKNSEKFRVSGDLRITTDISERILRLPMFPELKTKEVDFICAKILDFYKI